MGVLGDDKTTQPQKNIASQTQRILWELCLRSCLDGKNAKAMMIMIMMMILTRAYL